MRGVFFSTLSQQPSLLRFFDCRRAAIHLPLPQSGNDPSQYHLKILGKILSESKKSG